MKTLVVLEAKMLMHEMASVSLESPRHDESTPRLGSPRDVVDLWACVA